MNSLKEGDLVFAYHRGIYKIDSFFDYHVQDKPAIGANLTLVFDKDGNHVNFVFKRQCNIEFCETVEQRIERLKSEIKQLQKLNEKIKK